MPNFVLRPLRIEDEGLFQDAVRAFDDESFPFAIHYEPGMLFGEYVRRLEAQREASDLVLPQVPDTVLFAFQQGVVAGRVSIRHRLNERLARIGGHIGYGVVPRFRRRGIATEMLRRALPIAKAVGIQRALLTCDESNIGSRKTIESCGGIFETHIDDPETGTQKRRYWIDLSA